ncbi:5-formyltetrahydrofolate cyclo-ligase [Brunnivagina elsteri]|uniref:5-formyltetrahydrofolate cyclo-ligase n=1 Tax=Brunnivagina elsteri CCALA 953 TaxID=987040 RepID=A0A2A2TC58_9CYAN|nr:5-formyltetrahydrofolate cyclo-ligase [Calothrix elsteri]PAX50992.1 5-formyltetrahydrofolate cyclo-ligase [Calothrix elsteri CCALA 953]
MSEKAKKIELRHSLLKKRTQMSVTEWREKSDRICTHLQVSPLFTQAKTILLYFSFRQEADLSPLFANSHYRWGFPRCLGKNMFWHSLETQNSSSLQVGTYGIIEPNPDNQVIQPCEVDLILVPSVACDSQCFRLGYGGGYYDRMLSLPEWNLKPTIGIVFEFAYLPELPIQGWDKPLQNVCTENGIKPKI